MPNSFAYLALTSWPIVTFVMFLMLPVQRAVLCSLLGGYLLLPPVAALEVPGLPPIDKTMVAGASSFLGCLVTGGKWIPLLPRSRLALILLLLFIFTPVASVLTNREPIFFKVGSLPGLGMSDIIHSVSSQLFAIIPFFLARHFLSSASGLCNMILIIAVSGVLYSLPMLIEIRMSPQINVWIYGFFQHQFDQMVRYGGYRPIVFLQHGLWVALFATMALLAAVALYASAKRRCASPWLWISAYLAFVLLLCKSAAALLYALFALPLLVLSRIRLQLAVAGILAFVAIAYPLLRGLDLVPVKEILQQAAAIDPDRAQSLETRFVNEDQLLERAREKPLFGWSLWGRNHIHNYDTGEITSITDGRWIIVLGSTGWFGYIGEFGLLALPVFLLWRDGLRQGQPTVLPEASALALLLAVNLIDMLPNATLTPITWLLAGALLGYVEQRDVQRRSGAPKVALLNAETIPAAPARRTIL